MRYRIGGILFLPHCSFLISSGGGAYSQDEASSDTGAQAQELSSGRQEIMESRQQIKENAAQARGEEKQLREQINQAMQSGDMETANQLKDQLRSVHQENMQQKRRI
jgi:DNA-binding ferritin-like protein